MTKTGIAYALFLCNIAGLVLAWSLAWAARKSRTTPDGRARILSSVSVGAFGVAGLAKRFHSPYSDHIVLGAWIVVLVSQAWKLSDQHATNVHDKEIREHS